MSESQLTQPSLSINLKLAPLPPRLISGRSWHTLPALGACRCQEQAGGQICFLRIR